MQSSKISKKNGKPAAEKAASAEVNAAKEVVAKSRASRTPKKAESTVGTSAAKSHRKAAVPAAIVAEPSTPKTMTAAAGASTPTHEEIAALAYTYWVERGYEHGHEKHDWARAEAALKHRS